MELLAIYFFGNHVELVSLTKTDQKNVYKIDTKCWTCNIADRVVFFWKFLFANENLLTWEFTSESRNRREKGYNCKIWSLWKPQKSLKRHKKMKRQFHFLKSCLVKITKKQELTQNMKNHHKKMNNKKLDSSTTFNEDYLQDRKKQMAWDLKKENTATKTQRPSFAFVAWKKINKLFFPFSYRHHSNILPEVHRKTLSKGHRNAKVITNPSRVCVQGILLTCLTPCATVFSCTASVFSTEKGKQTKMWKRTWFLWRLSGCACLFSCESCGGVVNEHSLRGKLCFRFSES